MTTNTTTTTATFLPKSTIGAESLPSIFSSFLSVEDNEAVTLALTKNNNQVRTHLLVLPPQRTLFDLPQLTLLMYY